jgi:lactoylglutathione lyase
MGEATLSLVVLKTRQVDKLLRFYNSIGIEMTEEQHGKGPIHFSGRVGDLVLELYPLREVGIPVDATTRLGFTVANVDKVVQALQALGTPIDTEPQVTKWGFRGVVRDPDGRAIELYQR